MMSTLKYLRLTVVHKWFVLVAGVKIGCPIWRLVIHDWTKLIPQNLYHYGKQFFGDADDAEGFVRTWVRHQNAHDHHWEFWIPRTGHNRCSPPYPANKPIPMPRDAVLEMVADWLGASKAYGEGCPLSNKTWPWLESEYHTILIHPRTRLVLDQVLTKNGIKLPRKRRLSDDDF